MEFAAQLQDYLERVERAIDELVPPADTRPVRLHEAMRYSLQAGGKRLRPTLVLATAGLFGRRANPLPAAVALECIHTYSLVHDDLPCMDNDDLRRGRPTAHKQFDDATALLAGDGMLTLAFQLLSRHYASTPALATELVREFADAAGSEQLIGGQMEDLLAEGKPEATAAELKFIHLNKTAAMIAVALVAGGLCGGASAAEVARLREAGRSLGLAFQIVDDVLDATADTATLGKTAGKDAKDGKTTYVKLHGLETARLLAREQTEAAVAAIQQLPGDTTFLLTLMQQMASRKN
ncbi:MAG: polyprenyl synthetase family protein [Candidatus Didemnitutus sp.]|nr:polyprenyl synthetase family protein [Candidatus Didemnitutus sp.]